MADRELQRVQTFAKVMDHYLVDPLMGLLLPGIGDLLGSLFGFYIVIVAARRKVSPVVIARMIMNLATDALVGIVPLLGDAIDFAFKANERNVALLVSRDAIGGRATGRDWGIVVGALIVWIALTGLAIYGFVRLLRAIA